MSDLLLSKFYKFLTESIPTSVVKFGNEARKYETVETKIAGDHYISANMKTDSLLAYQELPESLLLDAGLATRVVLSPASPPVLGDVHILDIQLVAVEIAECVHQ